MELKDIYGLESSNTEQNVSPIEETKVGSSQIMGSLPDYSDFATNNVVEGQRVQESTQKQLNINLQKSDLHIGSKQQRLSSFKESEEMKESNECTVCLSEPISIMAYP